MNTPASRSSGIAAANRRAWRSHSTRHRAPAFRRAAILRRADRDSSCESPARNSPRPHRCFSSARLRSAPSLWHIARIISASASAAPAAKVFASKAAISIPCDAKFRHHPIEDGGVGLDFSGRKFYFAINSNRTTFHRRSFTAARAAARSAASSMSIASASSTAPSLIPLSINMAKNRRNAESRARRALSAKSKILDGSR